MNNVSLTINIGEKFYLIGENGSGKTTLLKILYGIEPIDSGYVVSSPDTKIGYLSQLDIDQYVSMRDILKSYFTCIIEVEKLLFL